MMRASDSTIETLYYQAGLSDSHILCDKCEPRFAEWDSYGFDVLGRRQWKVEDSIRRIRDDQPIAIQLIDMNYDKLMLFILSVLWRASVSKERFYQNVNLGPGYERRIRETPFLLGRFAITPARRSASIARSAPLIWVVAWKRSLGSGTETSFGTKRISMFADVFFPAPDRAGDHAAETTAFEKEDEL
jgi:hypothetical protein